MKIPAKFILKSSTVAIAVGLIASIGANNNRISKLSCGCGDICVHKGHVQISCELPGCAREHDALLTAHRLLIKKDLEKETGIVGEHLKEIGDATRKWLSSRVASKMVSTR